MGSAGEPHDKGIDGTVGTLVWVRRRNGSWWPGQIIELDESREVFSGSLGVGTPIKLLGREDAPVDWYNLEKSKRVKPFRCGEFDDCIERAILAASNPPRKAVKYVRREDAILHALEIEMGNTNADVVKPATTVPISSKDSGHTVGEFTGFNGKSTSAQGLIHNPNKARARRTPYDSEDEEFEGSKRMKGLRDLGMGSIPEVRRKRTPVGLTQEFPTKKSPSGALIEVLESTPLVSAPVMSEKIPSPLLFESKSRDSVISLSANPETCSSRKLFDVPLVPKKPLPAGMGPSYISYQKPHFGALGGRSSDSSQVETLSLGNETVSTSSGATDIDSVPLSYGDGNSKWDFKGKYTSKYKNPDPRKIVDVDDDFNDNDSKEYWGRQKFVPGSPLRQLPPRRSRSIINPKYGPEFSLSNQDNADDALYDVLLEVNAKTRPQRVPFTCIMSQSTNLPVVGHPLPVEILEDNYTDGLIRKAKTSVSNDFATEYEGEHNTGDGKSRCISPNKTTKLRTSAPSSKKTRKLSSISGFCGLNEGEGRIFVENMLDYAVACIPLKVVFSRINADLRNPMQPPKRVVKLGKH